MSCTTLFKYEMHLKMKCVQAHCWGYFEATEIDRAIDQLKPGLKSMTQVFLLFKERVSNMPL